MTEEGKEEGQEQEGTPLRVLGLSERVFARLYQKWPWPREGPLFVEDVRALLDQEESILALQGFGPKTVGELRGALQKYDQ